VQLFNSQKLAERQSCYSGSKENLIEDNEGEGNDPQRNPKENYIGQNHGKEETNLVVQLNQVPIKRQKQNDWYDQTSTNQR